MTSKHMRSTKAQLQGSRILVTGASGFVGSYLIEHLIKQGASVRALVRRNLGAASSLADSAELDVFRGDLSDPKALRNAVNGVEIVYHLATARKNRRTYGNVRKLLEINTKGTANLLEACQKKAESLRRAVVVSSAAVYGDPGYSPIGEDAPLEPRSLYAASKAAAEMVCHAYVNAYSLPIVIARPSNIFGPRQRRLNVVIDMIEDALESGMIRIGNPRATRDFIFAQDVARGLALMGMIDGIEGEVFNLGTGKETSLRKLAQMVRSFLPRAVQLVTDRSVFRGSREIYHSALDCSKAARELQWKPERSVREGIQLTTDWALARRATAKRPKMQSTHSRCLQGGSA